MIYIYDILLNWTKDLRLNEFYEWTLEDDLEHIKKIPLLRVEDDLIKDLMTSKIKLDKEFLIKIKNKAEGYFQSDIDIIDYAAILSNGKKAIAVELDDEGVVLYKSVMLLDEEEETLEMSMELVITPINYEILKTTSIINTLTRKEATIKKYLEKEIKKIKLEKQTSKLNYLYKEFFQDELESFDDKYNILNNEIKKEYNNFHKKLYNLLKLTTIKKNNV